MASTLACLRCHSSIKIRSKAMCEKNHKVPVCLHLRLNFTPFRTILQLSASLTMLTVLWYLDIEAPPLPVGLWPVVLWQVLLVPLPPLGVGGVGPPGGCEGPHRCRARNGAHGAPLAGAGPLDCLDWGFHVRYLASPSATKFTSTVYKHLPLPTSIFGHGNDASRKLLSQQNATPDQCGHDEFCPR